MVILRDDGGFLKIPTSLKLLLLEKENALRGAIRKSVRSVSSIQAKSDASSSAIADEGAKIS